MEGEDWWLNKIRQVTSVSGVVGGTKFDVRGPPRDIVYRMFQECEVSYTYVHV